MSKALVVIKSMGIGDLLILISNIHAISKKISEPVTVLAQKNTHAHAILEHDPHIEEVIELDEREIKSFFEIIKKIKPKRFDHSYIFSDSIRLYLIAKLSGIKQNFHYNFFSKRGKNFFKNAKEFTEKTLNAEVNPQSKIYIDKFPLNIIYVGEIFRIFPKAKFIVSLRHPCDCVLSSFMQTFSINNAMANFLNLEDSAKLYDLVMKLWIQYTSIFPINYYEVRYENLVENLETTVKPLLKFLELPWHDSVLEFYKTAKKGPQIKTPSYDQVIKPIYSESVGNWKLYKKQITNIYPILKPWIKKFDY